MNGGLLSSYLYVPPMKVTTSMRDFVRSVNSGMKTKGDGDSGLNVDYFIDANEVSVVIESNMTLNFPNCSNFSCLAHAVVSTPWYMPRPRA